MAAAAPQLTSGCRHRPSSHATALHVVITPPCPRWPERRTDPRSKCHTRPFTAAAATESDRNSPAGGSLSVGSVLVLDAAAAACSAASISAVSAPSGAAAAVAVPAAPPSKAVMAAAEGGAAPGSMSAPRLLQGINALHDPYANRGLATPASDRDKMRLHGLLPARQVDASVEVRRAAAAVARAGPSPLAKYQALMTLRETDVACFADLVGQDVETYLPYIYTPTVGDACLNWGTLLPRPSGLYISLQDAGRVQRLVDTWPVDNIQIAVITDGERILGLGDLGAHGMGIPVGKAAVYAAAAGADTPRVLPITVDAGCDTPSVRADPFYVGLAWRRERGSTYYALMDELVAALRKRYGQKVVVHWEDVGTQHAFALLARLQDAKVPTFSDDIQCTAAISVAAILAATRVAGVPPLREQRFLLYGAGQAGLGCAKLLEAALRREGLTREQAKDHVWLMDSKGLLVDSRAAAVTQTKAEFVQRAASVPPGTDITSLPDVVARIQPTALIGSAAVGGAFDKTVLQALLQATVQRHGLRARPVVLALSNPTSRCECTFREAYDATDGRAIYASGTAFPALLLDSRGIVLGEVPRSSSGSRGSSHGGSKGGNGAVGQNDTERELSALGGSPGQLAGQTTLDSAHRRIQPAQANNCYVFPGIGLGAVRSGVLEVTDAMLLAAADVLAGLVTSEDLEQDCVLPSITRLKEVTAAVAGAIITA